MDRREDYSLRTAAIKQRISALDAGAEREATYRAVANIGGFAAAAGVVLAGWPVTAPWLVAAGLTWIAVRVIGNVVVDVWAAAAIRRVRDRFPLPPEDERG